jgi:hypothetical protein
MIKGQKVIYQKELNGLMRQIVELKRSGDQRVAAAEAQLKQKVHQNEADRNGLMRQIAELKQSGDQPTSRGARRAAKTNDESNSEKRCSNFGFGED